MDRKVIDKRGFTLIEIMIVLVIAGLLSAFGMIRYSQLSTVNSINNDMQSLGAFVHKQKMFAFTRKQCVHLIVTANLVSAVQDPSCDDTLGPLNDPIGDDLTTTLAMSNTLRVTGPFSINTRGNLSPGGNIGLVATNTGAEYSCVQLDNVRTRLGDWNGVNCTPK